MKKVFTKILLSLIIGVVAISSIAMVRPVEASSISASPLTYQEYNFSFTGQRSISQICTGTFLTLTVNCTSTGSSNEEIEVKIYVQNTKKTTTKTFKPDGQDHKFSNIYLGLFGGDTTVTCTFTNKTTGYSTISGKITFNS